METKKIQAVITSANVTAHISGGQINATIGEAARMETQKAINYIKSGQAEIAKAVEDGKSEFDANAEQKTTEFNDNAIAKTGDYDANYLEKLN